MNQLKTGVLFYPEEVMEVGIRIQISHTPKFVALLNYMMIIPKKASTLFIQEGMNMHSASSFHRHHLLPHSKADMAVCAIG